MATPESIGVTTCAGRCKRDVDVKLNSGNFAYYHCPCGHSERTHNASSSRHFVSDRVRPLTYSGNIPEIPAKTDSKQLEKSQPPAPDPAGKIPPPPAKKKAFLF
jgi:hypothetical protein